ncbi:hypothetical protein QBC46DRAFT_252511 [Diplogelasinospora grovesii]|uniref:Tat pathway signal sequence n=1 Tax=Diplogelasinospora grovesii TaxID=303347 RepID=A0AAN6S8H6_9PEZI|nr:hypothetical protein QBC46DRAFT_252511 [Diplogelasinospora grovesii]
MGSYSEDSEARLLHEAIEYSDGRIGQTEEECRPNRHGLRKNVLGLGILALLLYNAALLTFEVASTRGPAPNALAPSQSSINDEHFTLPRDSLLYEERKEWDYQQYPWNQEPSEDLDAVWDDLLHPLNIRITPEEMGLLNENTTDLLRVDNGDYVAVMGVYHFLHCLNNLRRIVHWDYYGPRLANTKHPEGFSKEHSDHCIDAMRQALMCHANTVMYLARWTDDSQVPISNQIRSDADSMTCVDWSSLESWATKRALHRGTYKYLPRMRGTG